MLQKYSYPKCTRLLKREDFLALQKEARKYANSFFLLLVKDKNLTQARLGLIVTKKLVKLAVDRNRIKRICRESFRHYCALLPTRDCLIIARKDMQRLSKIELREKLDKEWEKLIKSYQIASS